MNEKFFSLSAQKQQAILNAGYRVFSQNSYGKSPMREIAEEAGISKALTGLCFGLSAFARKGSTGAGLGIAAMMYFLNLAANITEKAEFLKYITPFGYTECADIVSSGSLNGKLVALGMAYAAAAVSVGSWQYCKKDIP